MTRIHMRLMPWALCLVVFCTSALAERSAPADITAMDSGIEQMLELLSQGDIEDATALAQDLSTSFPDFRLAQWLYAELMTVAAMDIPLAAADSDWSGQQVNLLLEAKTRLDTYRERRSQTQGGTEGWVPRSLAHLGDDITDAILVDLSRSELLYFTVADGEPRLAQRHYISSGSAGFGKLSEGDLRTPLGVYRIRGYRSGDTLPALYGDGALTLDYPNALDRALGRTGSGIWLHGIPRGTRSRAPWSSEGCVTMSNEHLDRLVSQVDRPGTVVVLTDSVRWIDAQARVALRQRWQSAVREMQHPQWQQRLIGPETAPAGDTAIDRGTLMEVPDIDGSAWLAWWPAGVAPGSAAWRFLPLPPAPGEHDSPFRQSLQSLKIPVARSITG